MRELIDRAALIAEYDRVHVGPPGGARKLMEDAPTIEERKKGEWIEENTRPRSSQFYCSVCDRTAYDPQPTRAKGWIKRCRYAFCPNCGAYMRGDKE